MSADILERLEARLALRAEPPEWANPPVYVDSTECRAVLREAASEIVRLRGEVDARISPDWVIGYFPADVAEEVKRAVRDAFGEWNALSPKPAPAMPNGVEASPANCRERLRLEGRPYPRSGCAHCKLEGLTGCPYEKGVHNSGRAADNRDAAGVCDACGGAGMVGHYAPDGPFGEDCPACAPAAVPAGEAVAWLASDGEVFTDKESADRHSKVWGVNPLLTPLYTTPPAPVQAAPQEGEVPRLIALIDAEISYNRNRVVGGRWSVELDEARKIAVALAAHHSACELGVPPEMAIAASGIRSNGMYVKGWNDCREATLQHRGDSQEVGRG